MLIEKSYLDLAMPATIENWSIGSEMTSLSVKIYRLLCTGESRLKHSRFLSDRRTVKVQRIVFGRLEGSQTPNKYIYLDLTKHQTKMLSHPSIKLDVWEIEATGGIQSFLV
ncbi:MAG: hypothetical protein WA947_11815, partial [Phormidesmis sp.]